jgi:ABC-type phosphate/phosphonate transport system substrate-binding protein
VICCFLLLVTCLGIALDLFNVSLPSWVSALALALVFPGIILLLVEAIRAPVPVKARNRRAFLTLSAITLGLLTVNDLLKESSSKQAIDSLNQEIDKLKQKTRELEKGLLTQLRMGFVNDGDIVLTNIHPFENILSNLLEGIPVSSVIGETYADIINDLAHGNVEVGWLGPLSYLRAHQNFGVRVILHTLTAISGQKTYKSYIISNAKANIHNLEHLV